MYKDTTHRCKKAQKLKTPFLFLAGLTLFTFLPLKPALSCVTCNFMVSAFEDDIWLDAKDDFDEKLDEEFVRVEKFILHQMWEESILPVMMLAAEQFSIIAAQQAMIIGMFIDAEIQLDSQRLLQEIQAKAHKDYHPSLGMCEFGSIMKSLAATERKGEVAAVILSQRSQDRHWGKRKQPVLMVMTLT